MGVIVGTIRKLDPQRRVLVLGSTEVRVAEGIAFEQLVPGVSVTVTCEQRNGQYWATAIKTSATAEVMASSMTVYPPVLRCPTARSLRPTSGKLRTAQNLRSVTRLESVGVGSARRVPRGEGRRPGKPLQGKRFTRREACASASFLPLAAAVILG